MNSVAFLSLYSLTMGTMNVQFLQWVSMEFNPHGQKCVPEAKSFQLKIVGDVESSSAVAAQRL